jgi:predicted ribosomally synthesized peptide with SipW-like signal peptide
MKKRRLRVSMVLALAVAALFAQTGSSLALFTEVRTSAGNPFTAGIWAFYLHNNPTPPTANVNAVVNLAMNSTAPTKPATLYQYSMNCATQPGRRLTRANPSPTQATVCRYENWRTPVLTAAMTLSGAITVDIWSATDNNNNGRTGGIVAYLRDYNPTGGTYVELANGLYSTTYAITRHFYNYPITVTLATTKTVPAGHQLELKLVASNAYQANMLVAYDTTGYPSLLSIR